MRVFFSIFFFLVFVFVVPVGARILPAEGSKLNFRLVCFEVAASKGATGYVFQVAEGKHVVADSFVKHLVLSENTSHPWHTAIVPSFGKEYTWRVLFNGSRKTESELYHFATIDNQRIDTTNYRLRILQANKDLKDGFVVTDGGGVFYDFEGRPVAFLPEVNGLGGFVIGLHLTEDSSLTFNFSRSAYETDLAGRILWKAPHHHEGLNEAAEDIYHHELKKLSNGNYMVLGMEFLKSKPVVKGDTSYILLWPDFNAPQDYQDGLFGTILEFDKSGKVVWSWKDSKHLVGGDFDYFNDPFNPNFRLDPHSNSFYFDEKKKVVYLSYRNLNRILKIDYKTGEILDTYGAIYKPGVSSLGYGLFCNPHGVQLSSDGLLYYFNNNSCHNTDSLPTVIALREPTKKGDSLAMVWKYDCTVEGNNTKRFGSGGSVVEMPDRNFFVCMGNEYSKMFIVSRGKDIKWSALPERYIHSEGVWTGNKQYRANYLQRSDLEKLVWRAEGK